MPLFDFLCVDCGAISEILLSPSDDIKSFKCRTCSGHNLKKLMAAHSSISGAAGSGISNRLPGHGDTGCCGSGPGHADCQGPGSCCGKNKG